jgi:6-phosphogluconate dehydrogenase (decarboxylating)
VIEMTRTLSIVSSKSGTAAIDEGVPAEVLSAALYARFRSRREHTFADKILRDCRQNLKISGLAFSRVPAAGG